MTQVYLDPKVPLKDRIKDLISRMTPEEKASQLRHDSPAIPRLGIPEYNWWNEGLHGVARAGKATVFPQAIGLAATFDPALIERIFSAVSDEARAKHHAAAKLENRSQYRGLSYWTPNINIFRDPRWGRGQETYGEDPWLSGLLGRAVVRGLQGKHPRYLKLAACAKHYAVHSGPEALRHGFDAKASPKDMRETYLPAFKALVDEGVESVMGAYNRVNGEPACASEALLERSSAGNGVSRGMWSLIAGPSAISTTSMG
jgi:beta-glucosidase